MRESDANAGLTKTMWLFMLEQGGHWTALELARKLRADRDTVDRIVYFMVRTGCAAKFRHPHRKNGVAFGVTGQNRVPREMLLADLLKAAGI